MNELRSFIEVDNHEAVKIGGRRTRRRSKQLGPISTEKISHTRQSGKEWTN